MSSSATRTVYTSLAEGSGNVGADPEGNVGADPEGNVGADGRDAVSVAVSIAVAGAGLRGVGGVLLLLLTTAVPVGGGRLVAEAAKAGRGATMKLRNTMLLRHNHSGPGRTL